ncbi:MAG: PGPGW domain-containing protein [Planctomycetaceae bacterium]
MFDVLKEWIDGHRQLIAMLAVSSLVVGVGSLIAIPWIIIRLPADYFVGSEKPMTSWRIEHPGWRVAALALKNVLGIVFFFAGIALLVFPGQGVLTMLIGLMMLNFPGKRRLERWIVNRPRIFKALNWIRHRADRPSLVLDETRRLTSVK